ncbi:MAG: hypothetical protein AAFO79_00290 [Pseudomonadota bacterium]
MFDVFFYAIVGLVGMAAAAIALIVWADTGSGPLNNELPEDNRVPGREE